MGYKYRSGKCPTGHVVADVGVNAQGECKGCIQIRNDARYATPEAKAAAKAWNASPAGKVIQRDTNYRGKGIQNADGTQFTTSTVIDAFFLQNGDCAFCLKPLLEDINADHDHITFKFRSLLHRRCNSGMVSSHTIESALRLVQYLRGSQYENKGLDYSRRYTWLLYLRNILWPSKI